jgi:anthraniloyl-CoA monooxygenase
VVSDEEPAFGRSYQTPYADRIRNEIGRKYGIAVIAVGAISSYDDVNSIILAGRADFCALGRAHLYDPQWTLHAAADQGYSGPAGRWPGPFAAGSRKPQTGRTDGPRPRLELVRAGLPGTAHARWRPRAHPAGPLGPEGETGPDGEAGPDGGARLDGEAGSDTAAGRDDGVSPDGAAAAPATGGERWRPSP